MNDIAKKLREKYSTMNDDESRFRTGVLNPAHFQKDHKDTMLSEAVLRLDKELVVKILNSGEVDIEKAACYQQGKGNSHLHEHFAFRYLNLNIALVLSVSSFRPKLSSESPSPSQVQSHKVQSQVQSLKSKVFCPRTWTLLTVLSLLHHLITSCATL